MRLSTKSWASSNGTSVSSRSNTTSISAAAGSVRHGIEWRIDQLVKRYAERGGELKFHQRFRFNNLSQTYAKYKDIFRKKVALKEEGKIQRHFGAAAKEIEAARAKKKPKSTRPRLGRVSPRHFASRVPSRSVNRRRSSQLFQAFLQDIHQGFRLTLAFDDFHDIFDVAAIHSAFAVLRFHTNREVTKLCLSAVCLACRNAWNNCSTFSDSRSGSEHVMRNALDSPAPAAAACSSASFFARAASISFAAAPKCR